MGHFLDYMGNQTLVYYVVECEISHMIFKQNGKLKKFDIFGDFGFYIQSHFIL